MMDKPDPSEHMDTTDIGYVEYLLSEKTKELKTSVDTVNDLNKVVEVWKRRYFELQNAVLKIDAELDKAVKE